MKFLYYLACIGNPKFSFKLKLLESNLNYIYQNINTDFDIIVNLYSVDSGSFELIKETLSKYKFIKNKYIYQKKGVLTELFLTNIHNNKLENYDYILFILDDVKIINLELKEMIKIKRKYEIKFISPKVLKSTHSWMRLREDDLTINNFLEIYCLLLTPEDIRLFFSCYSIENKWMWGVDFMFGHLGIKTGVVNKFVTEHMLPSHSNGGEATGCMINYFNKTFDIYGIRSLTQLRHKYKPIKEIIKFEN